MKLVIIKLGTQDWVTNSKNISGKVWAKLPRLCNGAERRVAAATRDCDAAPRRFQLRRSKLKCTYENCCNTYFWTQSYKFRFPFPTLVFVFPLNSWQNCENVSSVLLWRLRVGAGDCAQFLQGLKNIMFKVIACSAAMYNFLGKSVTLLILLVRINFQIVPWFVLVTSSKFSYFAMFGLRAEINSLNIIHKCFYKKI